MRARTVSAICLRPSGNTQGSFYYYILWTGRRLHRRRRTPLPVPQEVIDRVHHIATTQNSPEGLAFTSQDETPFESEDDDESVQDNMDIQDNDVDTTEHAEMSGVAANENVLDENDDEARNDDVNVQHPPHNVQPDVAQIEDNDTDDDDDGDTIDNKLPEATEIAGVPIADGEGT